MGINFIDKIVFLKWDYEPIKSLITASLYFYGLMGNMSIRASIVEYVLFYVSLLFLLYKIIININKNKRFIL